MKHSTLQAIANDLKQLHTTIEVYNAFMDNGDTSERRFSYITGTATMEVIIQNLLGEVSVDYADKLGRARVILTNLTKHSSGCHFHQFILNDFECTVTGHIMSEDYEQEQEQL